MTNVGNAGNEYDAGNARGDDDAPNNPPVATARFGDSKESYGDAALNEDSAGGVEVFGDEEELGSFHDITGMQLGSKLTRSEIAADNA